MPINNFVPTQAPNFSQTPTGAAFQSFGSLGRGAIDQALAMQEQAKATVAPQMARQQLAQAVQHTMQAGIHTQTANQHLQQAAINTNQMAKLVGPTVALKTYQAAVQQAQKGLIQKQQQLTTQQQQLVQAQTNTARAAAIVAHKTIVPQIAAKQAAAAQKQAEAKKAGVQASMEKGTILAQRSAMFNPITETSMLHPGLTRNPIVTAAGQAGLNAATKANNAYSGEGVPISPPSMQSYFSNPQVPTAEKVQRIRSMAQNAYESKFGKGKWNGLSYTKKNDFLKQYAQQYGIK